MAYKFNPTSGFLEFVSSTTKIEFAEKISSIFDCDVSAAIGDIVTPSTITENKVDTITTNSYSNLAFGIIVDKPTSTTCEVLVSGKISGVANGISGLEFGKVAYINASGKISTAVPSTGHRQKMGMAIKSDELFLLPSLEKVILS